jgi:hypothetical protein
MNQQTSFWEVHRVVAPYLDAVGSWPLIGTPAWVDLADDDPRKLASLFDAARHWALRLEMCQESECEASHAISASMDWGAIARRALNQASFLARHPWLRRAAS